MKVITTSFLIICLLGKSFLFVGWELWYQFNQEEIATAHCENKARPAMHCNGKCYLAKQLKKIAKATHESAPKKTNPYTSPLEIQFFSVLHISAVYNEAYSAIRARKSFPANYEKTTTFSSSIFHPPCC